MYIYTYAMRQYEFFDNNQAMMVLLTRGLGWVWVKGFLSTISLWHELSKSALTQVFVERVDLLLVCWIYIIMHCFYSYSSPFNVCGYGFQLRWSYNLYCTGVDVNVDAVREA